MFKTCSQERQGLHDGLLFLACMFLLFCSVNMAHSKLFIQKSLLPNCHKSSDWSNCFSRSDSGSHAYTQTRHTHRQTFSFWLTNRQMLPTGKVMRIIRLVAPCPPPKSKYKYGSQQAKTLALTQDGGIPSVVLY